MIHLGKGVLGGTWNSHRRIYRMMERKTNQRLRQLLERYQIEAKTDEKLEQRNVKAEQADSWNKRTGLGRPPWPVTRYRVEQSPTADTRLSMPIPQRYNIQQHVPQRPLSYVYAPPTRRHPNDTIQLSPEILQTALLENHNFILILNTIYTLHPKL